MWTWLVRGVQLVVVTYIFKIFRPRRLSARAAGGLLERARVGSTPGPEEMRWAVEKTSKPRAQFYPPRCRTFFSCLYLHWKGEAGTSWNIFQTIMTNDRKKG